MGLIRGEAHINGSGHLAAASVKSGLALLFPAGARATAAELEPLLARPSQQAAVTRVSNQRSQGQGCLELLANELTFDVTSLAPEAAAPVAAPRRDRLSFRAVNRKAAPDYNSGLQRHHLLPRRLLVPVRHNVLNRHDPLARALTLPILTPWPIHCGERASAERIKC